MFHFLDFYFCEGSKYCDGSYILVRDSCLAGSSRGHADQAVFGEGYMFRFRTARVLVEDGILVGFGVVDHDCCRTCRFLGGVQYNDLLTG